MKKQTAVSLLVHFYHWLLHLYPSSFRDEFGEEMTSIFAAYVAETSHQGPRALVRLCLKEVVDLPASLAVAYWSDFSYREVNMHRQADWGIWPSWIVLHLLSIPLAVLLMLAIVIVVNGIVVPYHEWTTVQYVQLPALLLGFAIVTGTLQWLLLRRYLRQGMSWGIATSVGWLVAAILGYLGWLITESLYYSGNEAVSAGIILVSFGVTIGAFQYLVLRQVVTKAHWWIVANAIGYSSLILVVAQPTTSLLEGVFLVILPAIITGIVLFLLLRHTEVTTSYPTETAVPHTTRAQRTGKQKSVWVAAGVLAFILFCLVAPLVWTVGQLTLAKADGIYATPEEAMTARIMKYSGGYEIERIDILFAKPNRDGRLPHVWFVGANAYGEFRRDGKSTAPKGYYGVGSYFVKVADGWVQVSEGAFPELMGQVMAWYKLEDCCSTE